MGLLKAPSYVLPLFLLALMALTPVHAAQPSIPINGRYSVLTIKIYIPTTPKWAHDVVLNAAVASIAVGWTTYKYAPGSRTSIVSTQTYLTPTVFNDAQGSNATARSYAFWLALHELGRILGLGSILDGKDIMEPRYTPERITQVPNLSTLDLYALHILAQGTAPTFVTLPDGVQDQFTPVTVFLPST